MGPWLSTLLRQAGDAAGGGANAAGTSFIERQLSAQLPDEVWVVAALPSGQRTLQHTERGAPRAGYVDFLRSNVPAARLRSSGARDPVVVVLDGRAVGVVMPLAR
jgi:hypothetical protein